MQYSRALEDANLESRETCLDELLLSSFSFALRSICVGIGSQIKNLKKSQEAGNQRKKRHFSSSKLESPA